MKGDLGETKRYWTRRVAAAGHRSGRDARRTGAREVRFGSFARHDLSHDEVSPQLQDETLKSMNDARVHTVFKLVSCVPRVSTLFLWLWCFSMWEAATG